MARVNVDILGISELKWTGMGEFNSDDHYIYYCGQESLRRNGVAVMGNKRVWNAVLGCNLKNTRMASVCFQGKPFKQQVYAPTSNAEEAEVEWFCEDLQDLLELLLLLLLHHFSRVRLCVTRETAAHQAPLSLGFSGKNTGLGCHFLLQCMKVKSESEVAQSCPTLSDPMDCSLPGSSAHGIFQARVLEWGAISFSAFRTNTHKRCLFHYRGLECKNRKSRNTWSNR